MYCKNCGKEINDNADICIHCGVATHEPEGPAPVIDKINAVLVIVSILFPIVGVILGIVNLATHKRKSGVTYLLSGIGSWIITMILMVLVYSTYSYRARSTHAATKVSLHDWSVSLATSEIDAQL